ncbi:sigma factor [Streptomyces sp. NPDC048710]|uniref:sigma factor n=1 Tax=Streptomyces sp. NPDC048710 TaxID=3365586 RepID=UPI003715E180
MRSALLTRRDRLRAVAQRVLGSHADAEDVVQEAWLRLSRQDTGTIDNLGGWLTTGVGSISLDVLRSGRTRPEVALEVATRARVAGSAARGHAATVNGRPGVISWSEDGTPLSLLAFIVADGRITEITAVIDTARLAFMDLPDPV